MPKVELRYQQVRDARRFFEILSNPNFTFFNVQIKSVEEERDWLRQNPKRRKENTEWNYAILYGGTVVGAIGIKIHGYRKYIGEIGYFVDEKYWNKGIASKAVKLAEKVGFKKLGLTRIEIVMQPGNKGSQKVAIKNGYLKEGLLKKIVPGSDGKMQDAYLYAKVLK